ncbi:MAG: 50S ribosomal protein L11 methyltransferase [Candidatus Cryptobacteroides sp.]|nr:50S ribosomal protein L11 methyltransferase [Bacteroidales bacterium]
MNSSEYIEVTVKIDPFTEENAEIAEAMIAELPYDSFVAGESDLKCYIQKELYDRRAMRLILSGLPFSTSFNAVPVPFRNWNAEWESSFKPIVVGKSVTVKQMDDNSQPRTRYNIRLRPEMAFGTGHHDTTYMMLESVLEYPDNVKERVVMDMGCGTAVLGILAAKMGAKKVFAIDIDAVAAQSAFDNAHINRVGRKVEAYCGDASRLQLGKYDMLLANIHRNIIIMDLRTYSMSLKAGGVLLLSGFFDDDVPDVRAEAEKCGLQFIGRKSKGGWACLHFRRPGAFPISEIQNVRV